MRDWDDLRHFLAVARAGSTLGAARSLGVNQTTCARRIAALEATTRTQLFERRRAGYRLTEAGARLLVLAARVEREVRALEGALEAERRMLSGRLRATTNESIANDVLTPFLARFREAYPRIRVEVTITDRTLELARGEADVALRAGRQPEAVGVAVRRICHLPWTIYCARDYALRHGAPTSQAEIAGHAVIGGEGNVADIAGVRWLEEAAPGTEVVSRSGSLTNMTAAAVAGLGLAALPCMIGDREPALQRCFPPVPGIGGDLWLVVREEAREVPHVRAFLDSLVAHLGAVRSMLEGSATG
ncbi:LysR family transcriptional regulator [Falsiroseomonas oryzae]|uniref:LysR family transcriptional regulator n=1 Tax=Falsiroseomonas oryzae TaxID=2766473 RepID=UPI0022EB1E1E|nr:LysR family transcriptional regulator [Roseomonas sp. MO-31]